MSLPTESMPSEPLTALNPLLGTMQWTVPLFGPRRWWSGPLDVEGLALASVRAAATAATALAGEPLGLEVDAAHVFGAFGSIDFLRVDGRRPAGFAPLSGFFPTGEGWIRLHANYPHHEAALLRALSVTGEDQLRDALHRISARGAEKAIRAGGGIAAAVRPPDDWRQSGPGRAVDAADWIDLTLPTDTTTHRRAGLEGLRVLDLTRVIAGPTATQVLALLGAEVLRLDPPHLPELPDQHLDRDAGKRTTVADLRAPATLARVRALLTEADLLITSYRPGALTRFGLNWDAVHADFPHLVMVELNAWGRTGPWGQDRGFDSIVQAATGIAHLYGEQAEDGAWAPGALPVQALDHATGYGAAAAALALLHRRNTTAAAGHAHLSLARTAHLLLDLPQSPPGPATAPTPVLQTTSTPGALLRHTAPPVTRLGASLVYPHGPLAYGSSPLQWMSSPE